MLRQREKKALMANMRVLNLTIFVFGTILLQFILGYLAKPVLIGTWEAASWAVSFYKKHGFKLLEKNEKNYLLDKYWIISSRQRDTSVVLADEKWTRIKSNSQNNDYLATPE